MLHGLVGLDIIVGLEAFRILGDFKRQLLSGSGRRQLEPDIGGSLDGLASLDARRADCEPRHAIHDIQFELAAEDVALALDYREARRRVGLGDAHPRAHRQAVRELDLGGRIGQSRFLRYRRIVVGGNFGNQRIASSIDLNRILDTVIVRVNVIWMRAIHLLREVNKTVAVSVGGRRLLDVRVASCVVLVDVGQFVIIRIVHWVLVEVAEVLPLPVVWQTVVVGV